MKKLPFPLLTLLFVALKLTGLVNWSWLWVLSPLWISVSIVAGFWLIFQILDAVLNARSRAATRRLLRQIFNDGMRDINAAARRAGWDANTPG